MVSRGHWSTRTRSIVGIVVGIVVLVLAAFLWVGIRGLLAKSELTDAAPLPGRIEHSISTGDSASARPEAAALVKHADRARALTSDPVWRTVEVLPWIGTNLRAVRESASVTDTVANKVVEPLVSATAGLDIASFKPVNGTVDLEPMIAIAPTLASATTALDAARIQTDAIPRSGLIGPVSKAVASLTSSVNRAGSTIDPLNNAVKLLPAMLGNSGPRNYLVLFENLAEVRSTGGIAGAMALIHTDAGHITLAQQSPVDAFRPLKSPVLPLPPATESLYSQKTGEYLEDVNLPPQFPLSGQLASAFWTHHYGGSVDGVITIDPVVLSYILKATGPVQLPGNLTLTSSNAVNLLLSDAYRIFPNDDEQNAFFAGTAAAIFAKVSEGDLDPAALLSALAKGGSERRILMWSAHGDDQAVLAGTTLEGALPVSTPKLAAIGVYLNDTTAAKMDYYLHVSAGVVTQMCPVGDHPKSKVTVTLTNTAPADAATSLPAYVLGPGDTGIPAGSIGTSVNVYGPSGGLLVSTTSDGKDFAHHAATDDGHPVSQYSIVIAPGQLKTVVVELLNQQQISPATSLTVTPGLTTHVAPSVTRKCD